MAVSDFSADTSTIKGAAGEIRSEAGRYLQAYEKMSTEINNLKTSWTSEDGNRFIAKINSYREQFLSLHKALTSCAQTMETDAKNYEAALKANTIS